LSRVYRVIYTPQAMKRLEKMDRDVSERIYSWIGKNLVNTKDPYGLGKKLSGELSGLIRYRVGNYRIVAEVRDNELVILVIDIEHRKKIYDRF